MSLSSPSFGAEGGIPSSVCPEGNVCGSDDICLKPQKPDSYAREELWLSFPVYSFLGIWFIIAWLELGCPLRQRAGTALELGLKYMWSLKKKAKMKSEIQQDNLSFHTHWGGLARISLIANKHSNTLAAGTVGCWSKTPELREIQSS